MKPDWCDEGTWERAAEYVAQAYNATYSHDIEGHEVRALFARALIAAKNEGLEAASEIAAGYVWRDDLGKPSEFQSGGSATASAILEDIRSLHTEGVEG